MKVCAGTIHWDLAL